MAKSNQVNSYSIISLTTGILAIFTPVLGLILGILGVVLSNLALWEIGRVNEHGKGMAIGGLVCSIVGIVIHIFIVFGILALFYVY